MPLLDDDDIFNWNYGLSLTACKEYGAAEEVLLGVHNQKLQLEICYIASLCRATIKNGNAIKAWEIFNHAGTIAELDKQDALYLLQIIANDCYQTKDFIVAAKAFEALNQLDGNVYVNPMICACVGAFHSSIKGRNQESANSIQSDGMIGEILDILSKYSEMERVEYVTSMIHHHWMKDEM